MLCMKHKISIENQSAYLFHLLHKLVEVEQTRKDKQLQNKTGRCM